MPIRDLLILVGDIQQTVFGEMLADELQTHGHSATESGGDGHGGQTGQIDGDGVNVRQVHGDGVVHFRTDTECGGGRDRTHDDIDLRQSLLEIVADEAADFLRF